MFLVHLVGSGEGCDYTLGCNEVLVSLPKTVQTMEQAKEYVLTKENIGCLPYYGGGEFESVTIYRVQETCSLDVEAYAAERQRKKALQDRKRKEEEFERLKKELGK